MISPEQLRRYPFFGGLTAAEVTSIATIAEEVRFPDGAIIFRDGELATRLYVLVSGAIDLVYHIERTDGVEISFVGSIAAGEPFGISAFLEPYRLMATSMAHGPIQAIAIDAPGLRALCESNCHLGYTVMRQIARALAERLGFAFVELAACQ
jgi:CRP-like cAMP-binding protein